MAARVFPASKEVKSAAAAAHVARLLTALGRTVVDGCLVAYPLPGRAVIHNVRATLIRAPNLIKGLRHIFREELALLHHPGAV